MVLLLIACRLPLATRSLRGWSKLVSNLCRATASRAGSSAGQFSSSSRANDDRFTTPYKICKLADEMQLCTAQPNTARDAEIMDSLLSTDFAASCQGLCSDALLQTCMLLILTAGNSREVHASLCIICLEIVSCACNYCSHSLGFTPPRSNAGQNEGV